MAFLTEAANRGSISTGYNIDNSIKVQANSGNEWFYRDNPTAGNKRTFTFSFWMKRTQLDGYQADNYLMSQGTNARFHFAGHTLRFMFDGNSTEMEAAGKLRDTSAWYHIVLAVDTTQSTNTNRVKAYLNGEVYPFNNSDWPSLNQESSWMSGTDMYFNTRDGDGSYDNSGYWSEVAVVDGQQLDPTSFGEFDEDSGIWKPKDLSDITFGSEGFYLKFDNSGSLGADSSGNSNNVTLNNIAAANQATDTPTNNFCTINLPFEPYVGSPPTITEGATVMTGGASGQQDSYGTMALFKGKWYFEFSVLNVGGLAIYNMYGGVVKVNRLLQSSYNNAANGHHSHDGGWGGNAYAVGYHAGSSSGFTSVSGAAVDTVIGVAVDMDNGKIWWSSQGTYASSSGNVSNPATATLPQFTNLLTQYPGEPVVPAFNHYVHQASTQGAFNFGGYQDHAFTDIGTNSDANGYGSFAYTPPSGYYAICSKNLAEYG